MNHITTARFTAGRTTTTPHLWQYDYGQLLKIEGLELPVAYEVHFANQDIHGETKTVLGNADGVMIPDEFMQTGKTVYAWIFLHDDVTDGETEYKITIPVRMRPQPTNEEPTPVQQDIITQAIAALDAAVEQTGQDVETTAGYMDRAEQAAEQAEQASQGVEEYAVRAETAAESAEASATSATQSEQTATQAATAAVTAATQAGTSASQAQQAASDAGQAAISAVSAAEQAEASATTAEAKAEEATASASAAAGSAASAAGSETVASQAAQTATQAATQASQSATSASNSATSAAQSATSAEQSAQSAEQSAESILDVLPEIQQDISDLQDNKADKDGSYDYLTAGLANQLATNKGITDSVPYLMRPSGGGVAVGTYEQDKIVGGSIVWNQLIQNGNFADDFTGWGKTVGSSVTVTNGVCKFATTTSSNRTHAILQDFAVVSGRKYFCTATIKNLMSASGTFAVKYPVSGSGYVNGVSASIASEETKQVSGVFAPTADGTKIAVGINANLTAMDVFEASNVMLIDLTAMFGAAVADYIYSLETATAGAGVVWLKQHFPAQFNAGYQEYTAGEIKSVGGLVSHEMHGFNQWDEEWELGGYSSSTGQKVPDSNIIRCVNYIPVVPGADYCFSGTVSIWLHGYDKDYNWQGLISTPNAGTYRTFTVPYNVRYVRFRVAASYGTTYKHDLCINISCDRNGEYEPYIAPYSYPLDSNLVLRGIPKLDANNQLYYDGDIYNPDGTVERRYAERAYQSGDESLTDALTDGTVAVYKLTTPATETATPYQTPQLVDPDGTEEYVLSESAFTMPVGHETFYPADLKKKIEDLPNNFVEDVQVDGVSVVQDGVAEIPKELPNAPSSGEYVLKSNNGAVSWGSAPSGGGNSWELIVRYTVAEDSAQVDVNTDTNGQAFSLLKMLTRVKLPASLTGANDYIKGITFGTNPGGTALNAGLPTLRYGGTDKGYLEYIHEIMGDIMVVNARSSSSNGASSNVASLSNPDIGAANAYRTINGIRLQQYNSSSTMIPAGTIIEIYGIRQ